jgi:hypothetical protein
MRRIFSIAVASIAVVTTSAFAADILPLKRGFYVATDTPCEQASNATISLYDGMSFGTAHAQCRKWSIKKLSGGAYRVSRSCRDMQDNHIHWKVFTSTYKVINSTEFLETNKFGQFPFRYCKQTDLRSDWRNADLRKIGAE